MKLEASKRLLASNRPELHFIDHVIRDSWLEEKRAYVKSQPRNNHSVPAFGSETGEFNRYVLLPTSVLVKLKGQMGEHNMPAGRKLESLMEYMGTHRKLPNTDSGRVYVPNILVDYTGEPWINEGNNRIKAARQLGMKVIPVRIVYFTGGEREQGLLTPEMVKKYDAKAFELGFTFDNYGEHQPQL